MPGPRPRNFLARFVDADAVAKSADQGPYLRTNLITTEKTMNSEHAKPVAASRTASCISSDILCLPQKCPPSGRCQKGIVARKPSEDQGRKSAGSSRGLLCGRLPHCCAKTICRPP